MAFMPNVYMLGQIVSHPLKNSRGLRSRAAFTLFEVAISLVIVTFGVVSAMMLIPSGIKAQTMARMQILAAAKAEEMLEAFTHTNIASPGCDTEGAQLWDVPIGHRSQSWDIECRLGNHRYGLMPVPRDIAMRLDSDGDEIHRIISEGGNLYYSQPAATTNTVSQGQPQWPATEAQRLIIAITGYAQQNAVHALPVKNWPYYTPMPSPPLHTYRAADHFLVTAFGSSSHPATHRLWHHWPTGNSNHAVYPWEARQGHDPDVQKVYEWRENDLFYGYFPYACGRRWDDVSTNQDATALWNPPATKLAGSAAGIDGSYPSRESCLRYVQAAAWYFRQKLPGVAIDTIGDPYADYVLAENERWKEVQAYRFLAHAAICLTGWYSLNDASDTADLTRGVRIPTVTLDAKAGAPDFTITHNLLRYYHERALKLAHDFAARYPYDWSVPRPASRAIMMDHPLIQYDLFNAPYPEGRVMPPMAGNDPYGPLATIFGRSASDNPRQWRPITPEPVRNLGTSMSYPGRQLDGTLGNGVPAVLFGDRRHFNLTMPFAAEERCREIVFWAADWLAYEDSETAPSAPIDSSLFPIAAPLYHTPLGGPPTYNERLAKLQFRDNRLPTYRNPEKVLLFYPNKSDGSFVDVLALATGTAMEGHMIMNSVVVDNSNTYYPDEAVKPNPNGRNVQNQRWAREVFGGRYGADRNFNRVLDRGPLKPSVRLYATQVARFNFYDPRVPAVVR